MTYTEEKTWTREDFIRFLETTLIPDLHASESHSTAEDFETAIHFMKGKTIYDGETGDTWIEYPRIRTFTRRMD
jgi:hypothetical protein